jgi:hypothetical protein
LHETPIASSQYEAFGNNWLHWLLAAQTHYSLLESIENRKLERYYWGNVSTEGAVGIWDMRETRISRGIDIIDNVVHLLSSDQYMLTVELPRSLNRGMISSFLFLPIMLIQFAVVLVESTSIDFGPQKQLVKTDLLERYHNYAVENICLHSMYESG